MRNFLLIVLVVAVAGLYYIVLMGDVPEFSRKLELVERRLDSLIRRDGVEPVPEVQVGEAVVVLSDQQKEELSVQSVASVNEQMEKLVAARVKVELEKQLRASGLGQSEFYVPLGQASVKTSDNNWKDTQLLIEFNKANYAPNAKVFFEATLVIPTGNGEVQVRLYDVLRGPVVGSELSATGFDGEWKKSGELVINEGNRTLRVQMKTSMDFEGKMDLGRLKVVSN